MVSFFFFSFLFFSFYVDVIEYPIGMHLPSILIRPKDKKRKEMK